MEYGIPGYSLKHNMDPLRGTAVYFKDTIDPIECTELNDTSFKECLWHKINIDSKIILLGCIYRNTSVNKEESTKNLIEVLKKTNDIKYDNLVITGDFN